MTKTTPLAPSTHHVLGSPPLALAVGTCACSSTGVRHVAPRRAGAGEGLGDDAPRAVLLEDAGVDDALVDARGLEAALGDVVAAPDGLLEHAKVELALAADVVGHGVGDLGQGVRAGRVKDLGRAVVPSRVSIEFFPHFLDVTGEKKRKKERRRGKKNTLCVEVQRHAKVVERPLGELGAEEQRGVVDVGEEHQRVRVGDVLAEDGARLEDDLVGAKVVALEEDELVLVGQVEGPRRVLHEAEVERLDARRGRVGAVVAGGDELAATEADLDVVGARGEDGLVTGGEGGESG